MPAVAAILILISSAAAARFRQNEKETAAHDLQSCAHVGAAFAAFGWYRPTGCEWKQGKLNYTGNSGAIWWREMGALSGEFGPLP